MSELGVISNINSAWLLICTMIIFFMQAGFAMLEGGFVRSKNAVNVIMKNYIDMSVGAISFFAVGFGLMFGFNATGLFGADLFFPHQLPGEGFSFLFFQMMFAATAATIVSGALAERIRYFPYVLAAIIICSVIYPVFGSWVWGGLETGSVGWLRNLGFIDFAGSSVVHAVGGWSALAGIIVLGPRSGRFGKGRQQAKSYTIPGHNLPMAALGAFILWFGFFAFNVGSALELSDNLGLIALNTHLSGASGVLGSILLTKLLSKPLLMSFPINGGLGGLVAICAAADTVTPIAAMAIGLVAGVIVVTGGFVLEALRLDDAVGAVPVHAFAGSWGVIAVGLFSTNASAAQLLVQLIGAAAVAAWTLPAAWLMFKLINLFTSLRVTVADERQGLDYSEHYELGYPEFQTAVLHQGREEQLVNTNQEASALGLNFTDLR